MNYFTLIPARKLTRLADEYESLLNSWLAKWSRKPDQKVGSIRVSNAYEASDELASCDLMCAVKDSAGNMVRIFDSCQHEANGFNSILIGKGFANRRNDLLFAIKNDAIQALCISMFSLDRAELCYQSDSAADGMARERCLQKGSGSIIVSVEIGDIRLYMVVPQQVININATPPVIRSMPELEKIKLEDLRLQSREIQMSASIEKTVLTYRELINLKKYDVLVLDHKVDEKISLNLDGKSFGEAVLGSFNGNKAVLFS